MAITANVINGKLEDYNYKAEKKKDEPKGSDLGYDQFLQLLCAEMQYQDPLEPTSNTDYVAQLATFSQLEATLAQTDTLQSSTANSLVGKDVILKHVDSTTGKTSYVEGKVDYVMYQDNNIYLSVNDGLYPLAELDTVADEEYYEAGILAKTFGQMVAMLPDEYSLTTVYKGAIEQVRAIYDDMTEYQKRFVKKEYVEALEQIEEKLRELIGSEENEADAFKEKLAAVNTEGEPDEQTLETVADLVKTYDKFTVYQKTYLGEEIGEQMKKWKDSISTDAEEKKDE